MGNLNVILTTDIKPEDTIFKYKKGHLPDEQIRDLYVNKKISAEAIGKIFGFSGHTINRHLEKMNIQRRSCSEAVPNRIILPEAEIKEKYNSGESIYSIASQYKVSKNTIWRMLKRTASQYPITEEKLMIPEPENTEYNIEKSEKCIYDNIYFQIGQLVVSGYAASSIKPKN